MTDTHRVFGGRYAAERLLGQGGMADVYLGRDRRLGRPVAIKVLRSDLARTESFQARFEREAQAAASLNHPSIVGVYDTGEQIAKDFSGNDIPIPYIIMEYVEGRTVKDLIGGGDPLPVGQAADIMVKVLSALAYSHRAGIVHRDIKPANIMLTDQGEVKVMDFGIARALADSTSAMTATQAVMGTAQYLSPEQARGEAVDTRSDLYSAACVLYELLAGRGPFQGDSPVAIAYQHVRETPPPPSTFNPQLGTEIDQVALKGLAKERGDRYQTAREFADDIRAAVAGRETLAGAAAATTVLAADDDATQVLGRVEDRTQVQRPVAAGAGAAAAGAGAAGTGAAGAGAAPGGPGGPIVTGTGPDDPEQRRRGAAAWLVPLLVALLLGGLLLWWFVLRDQGAQTVAVPELTAETTQQEAEALLDDAGLQMVPVTAASEEVPEDNVISTDPAAGTVVPVGSDVSVTISSGPDSVRMQDLSGMTLDEAQRAVEGAGLEWGQATPVDSPEQEADHVISSTPAAGDPVAEGDTVQVTYASGRVPVPGLVGESESTARELLSEQTLEAEVSYQESSEAAGTVLGQNPTPDALLDQGSTVSIVVAAAAEPEPTPEPTEQPTEEPTEQPTEQPTEEPTEQPTEEPTEEPTEPPPGSEAPGATSSTPGGSGPGSGVGANRGSGPESSSRGNTEENADESSGENANENARGNPDGDPSGSPGSNSPGNNGGNNGSTG